MKKHQHEWKRDLNAPTFDTNPIDYLYRCSCGAKVYASSREDADKRMAEIEAGEE